MRCKLGGKWWQFRYANMVDYGDCTDPGKADGRLIRVRASQSERDMLDTIVHEALHACRAELAEEAVADTASDIARLLWRLGYRRVVDDKCS